MNPVKKWAAIGTASALGVGLLGGGAIAAASSLDIRDEAGAAVGAQGINGVGTLSFTPSPTSAPDAPTATPTTAPTPTSSATPASSPEPVTPQTPKTPATPKTPSSGPSPVTPPSAVSAGSSGSPD